MKKEQFIRGENLLWGGIALLAAVALCAQAGLVRGPGPRPSTVATAEIAPPPSPRDPAPVSTSFSESVDEFPSDLLVEAVVQIESGGRPDSVGRHGERGLMQLRAGTWGEVTQDLFGVSSDFGEAFDPDLNRMVGRAYLAKLGNYLDRHRGRWKSDRRSLLLGCYNAGPSRVRAAGFGLEGLPASTRDYISRTVALHDALMADRDLEARMARLELPADRAPARLGS